MATKNWVNIVSGNSLLPDGTKPLPEPMLSNYVRPIGILQNLFNIVSYLTGVVKENLGQYTKTYSIIRDEDKPLYIIFFVP